MIKRKVDFGAAWIHGEEIIFLLFFGGVRFIIGGPAPSKAIPLASQKTFRSSIILMINLLSFSF